MWQVNIHKLCIGRQAIGLGKETAQKCLYQKRLQDKKLFLKRLKKLYDKQGRLQKFTHHYNNFILNLDTTGMKFKRNVVVFPRLFEEFDYISSIQIYTPYEIWLNQILERKIIRSFKYSIKVRRILHDSFSLKSQERRRAERLYYEYHETWELYLEGNNIKN